MLIATSRFGGAASDRIPADSRRGTIASSSGRERAAPAARSTVRRESGRARAMRGAVMSGRGGKGG